MLLGRSSYSETRLDMATGFNEDVTALCQTVLFVRRGSQCVPFYRPQKFPLSLQR